MPKAKPTSQPTRRNPLWRVVDLLAPLFGWADRPLGAIERVLIGGWERLSPWLILGLTWLHRLLAISLLFCGKWTTRFLRWLPWSARLSALLAILSWLSLTVAFFARQWMVTYADFQQEAMALLEGAPVYQAFGRWEYVAIVVGIGCALCIPLTLIRSRVVLYLFKASGAAFLICWSFLINYLIGCPSYLFDTSQKVFSKLQRNELWVTSTFYWLPGLFVVLLFLYCQALRRMREAYGVPAPAREPLGDRIFTEVATGGNDPRFRTSVYWSVFMVLSVLIGPLLFRGCGMEEAYGLPQGSGNPVVEIVRIKQPKKKPKVKYILASTSPFIFTRMDIDDSKIREEVDKETEAEYQATQIQGKLGKGVGNKGGWPTNMPGRVRFLRLRYGGGDWDQDMGKGADYNMLIEFNRLTTFAIADQTEAVDIHRLKNFPKKAAPPFVFITGSGGIAASATDIKTLRWYCLEEGGMIFADNGGGNFNGSFQSLVSRVFPDKQWVDIPNDDIIYRQPFYFPNGAPPLWHHSGHRALGIKHNGRWVVFYHQGDMNDAWKDGHSGASKAVADQSFRLAVNVMNYAFNQYIGIHFGQ